MTAAPQQTDQPWLCIGGTLILPKSDGSDSGPEGGRFETRQIAPNTRAAADYPDDSELDTWCENAGICYATKDNYNGLVKGNAGYGNQNGAIGAFDIVLRTNLNGASARWKGTFFWEYGPELTFNSTTVECKKALKWLPDSSCGAETVDGPNGNGAFAISQADPVDEGPWLQGNKLTDAAEYYSIVEGYFTPAGYSEYALGVLEGNRFDCFGPTSNCLMRR